MFRKLVSVEDPLINAEAREMLGKYAGETVIYEDSPGTDEETVRRIGDADAVLVTFKTGIGRNVIEACPKLRYIGMCCTLFEQSCNVDLAAAREKGITVLGVRDYGDEGVVEYAIGEVVRFLHGFGDRQWKPQKYELGGLKAGIIGLGKTGRMTADAFRFFGSSVYYYNRSRKPDAEAAGIRYLPLHGLLSECDIIMTTLPRNTILLGEAEFRIMGGGKILINTSIGPTFDLTALKNWLRDHKDSYYFCDGTGRLSSKVIANIRQYLGCDEDISLTASPSPGCRHSGR